MPVFPCEHCGGSYELADADVGSTVVCPHCQKETTSAPVVQESGAAAMARDYTNRMKEENASRKMSPLTWLFPISSLVVTVLVHVLLVVIYMSFRPLPNVVVFWLPVVAGILVGLNLFTLATKSDNIDCPKWATPVALMMAVVLAVVPTLIAQSKYNMKVRRALIVDVNRYLHPPRLPAGTASCISASVPEATDAGNHTFTALLKGGATHVLTADVALYKASIVYDTRMKALQIDLAEAHVKTALDKCLEQYPFLASLEREPLEIEDTPKAGRYVGDIKFSSKLKLSYCATSIKAGMVCRLDAESHMRAKTIPEAFALWRRFDPESNASCVDVELGKDIDESHQLAAALLSDKKSIPLVIEKTKSADGVDTLSVFFQFREAAITRINEVLRESQSLSQSGVRRCVNVDKKRLLRNQEYSLRALFPEGEPLVVLATEDAYDVGIVLGVHVTLLAAKTTRAAAGWSLLTPGHYKSETGTEFVRLAKSEEDKLSISLETKPINAYARFSLKEYAEKERTAWKTGHATAAIDEIESWETASGLSGYRYSTRKGPALRIKYFFVRDTDLAIVSAVSDEASSGLTAKADGIVSSLRFKDVFQERKSSGM